MKSGRSISPGPHAISSTPLLLFQVWGAQLEREKSSTFVVVAAAAKTRHSSYSYLLLLLPLGNSTIVFSGSPRKKEPLSCKKKFLEWPRICAIKPGRVGSSLKQRSEKQERGGKVINVSHKRARFYAGRFPLLFGGGEEGGVEKGCHQLQLLLLTFP